MMPVNPMVRVAFALGWISSGKVIVERCFCVSSENVEDSHSPWPFPDSRTSLAVVNFNSRVLRVISLVGLTSSPAMLVSCQHALWILEALSASQTTYVTVPL